ncbi:hypothetical protein [Acinetobacter baumannii]|uniref:hypothetical protein n=1 Tax=Acinetobacter baumannii TaxID=470 RepID=UPI0023423EB1|nr:hypothetical protein [Acinetobacter baumannii]MDC4146513.1 hypothetical protein [Acinetobacter baumannii]
MNSMVSNNQNAVAHINSAKVVGIFKAIAPRSFEKTFEGIATEQINHAMKICLDGLTHEQVNKGLSMVRDSGYCPDPAMFRKWCLGIQGFGTEQQRAVDSFKKKNAALANIVKWLSDRDVEITNAEKEAYNRCYEMFSNLNYSNNYERSSYYAYEAFKDNYVDVVNEFVEKGITQTKWSKPPQIDLSVLYAKTGSEEKAEATPMTKEDFEKRTAYVESRIPQIMSDRNCDKSMAKLYAMAEYHSSRVEERGAA